MNRLLSKWLAALLIVTLLLTPMAMMEETTAGETVAVKSVNTNDPPAEPNEIPVEPEENPAEPEENPTEPEENPVEPEETSVEADDAGNDEDEPIIAEAVENTISEAGDVDLDRDDPTVREIEFELVELETTEGAYLLFDAGTSGASDVVINETSFPDQYFRAYVAKMFDNNPKNGTLSEAEQKNVISIDLSAWSDKDKITSLSGIHAFGNLKTLNASGTGVTELSFICSLAYPYSNLVEINAVGCTNLEGLYLRNDNVKALNVSNSPNLKELYCQEGALTQLDISGCTNLTKLVIWRNKLSELDLRSNKNLVYLTCSVTGLTKLDLSACKKLTYLDCEENSLTQLDLNGCTNLSEMSCAVNSLTRLDINGCTNLNKLDCGGNSLTQLDLSHCTNLNKLDCSYNSLTQLDLSHCTKLTDLDCTSNVNLKTLDISNCEVLVGFVDQNAPKEIPNTNPVIVGYGAYVDEWGEQRYHLTCDKGVTIITKKAEAPAPAPAPAPVASAPAPATPVINATAKNTSTSITAAPGTIAQLNLGGAAGKSFKSSNKKVATVDKNGNITFKKAGKVKITFKVGKKKRTVTIKVTDPTLPTNVAFQPVNTAVKKGESVTLTPVVNEGANPGGFKWKSSNKKVATVKNGVVKFKKKGKVTITCTSKRGKKKAKIKFNVSK